MCGSRSGRSIFSLNIGIKKEEKGFAGQQKNAGNCNSEKHMLWVNPAAINDCRVGSLERKCRQALVCQKPPGRISEWCSSHCVRCRCWAVRNAGRKIKMCSSAPSTEPIDAAGTLCTRGGKMCWKRRNKESQKNEYSSRGIPWDEVFYLCLYWVPAVQRIAPIWQHQVGLHVSLAVKVFRKSFVSVFVFFFFPFFSLQHWLILSK